MLKPEELEWGVMLNNSGVLPKDQGSYLCECSKSNVSVLVCMLAGEVIENASLCKETDQYFTKRHTIVESAP